MTKFIVRSDTIYAIAGINGGLEAYGIVDSSFVAVHTASASTSHYFQRAIALVNTKRNEMRERAQQAKQVS